MEAGKVVPSLVERGRREVRNARLIGSFVTPMLKRQAQRFLEQRVEDLRQARRSSVNPQQGDDTKKEMGGSLRSPQASRNHVASVQTTDKQESVKDLEPPTPEKERVRTIPIDGYDQLPSSVIVELLERLTPSECRIVAEYEGQNRKRRTVLTKARQLSSKATSSQ